MSGLDGTRVIVTRAEHQAEDLARLLREAGAEPVFLSTIEIAPPADLQPLQNAAEHLDDYDWILFSSANAATALADHVKKPLSPPRARIAAVGTATREAVERLGWPVEVVPDKFVAESLVEALAARVQGCRILLPSAAVARNVIPNALKEVGATVEVVEAYRNVVPEGAAAKARILFSQRPLPEWITFLSPSAVENLLNMIDAGVLREMRIAAIGPVTSSALHKHGLSVSVQPEEHTTGAMVQAMAAYSY
jgi:uroporphyrinogen-III synthase